MGDGGGGREEVDFLNWLCMKEGEWMDASNPRDPEGVDPTDLRRPYLTVVHPSSFVVGRSLDLEFGGVGVALFSGVLPLEFFFEGSPLGAPGVCFGSGLEDPGLPDPNERAAVLAYERLSLGTAGFRFGHSWVPWASRHAIQEGEEPGQEATTVSSRILYRTGTSLRSGLEGVGSTTTSQREVMKWVPLKV